MHAASIFDCTFIYLYTSIYSHLPELSIYLLHYLLEATCTSTCCGNKFAHISPVLSVAQQPDPRCTHSTIDYTAEHTGEGGGLLAIMFDRPGFPTIVAIFDLIDNSYHPFFPCLLA